jgi:stage II sporulation protein E
LQRTLPITEKKEMMKQDIADIVCKDCPCRNKCLRINGEYTTQVFDSLIDAGVNKGRVTDIDVNQYLLTRCAKVPFLISSTNEVVRSYREYATLSNNMDCSKVLVAEQFNGVSAVMQGIAKEIKEDILFDTELEKRIMEDLLYKNVFCEEVVVYEKNLVEKTIILLVRNDKLDNKVIEKVVSKICKNAVKIISIEPSELPNISVVTVATQANFDIIFGSATRNKAGVIVGGDTHSFIKIDNGKYMLALSDGMGSGSQARETSDLAITLIENYYRAGFDNELILSSVNKLLSLNNEESFSAIDLCVLDFFRNTMDFIKLGTPHSYIKTKSGVDVIKSSGLPIGILEEIRPHVTKKYINNFDTIILVSDGVSDAFGMHELKLYINSLNIINPQDLADNILSKAVSLSHGVCGDDMTVLVAGIFPTK